MHVHRLARLVDRGDRQVQRFSSVRRKRGDNQHASMALTPILRPPPGPRCREPDLAGSLANPLHSEST